MIEREIEQKHASRADLYALCLSLRLRRLLTVLGLCSTFATLSLSLSRPEASMHQRSSNVSKHSRRRSFSASPPQDFPSFPSPPFPGPSLPLRSLLARATSCQQPSASPVRRLPLPPRPAAHSHMRTPQVTVSLMPRFHLSSCPTSKES